MVSFSSTLPPVMLMSESELEVDDAVSQSKTVSNYRTNAKGYANGQQTCQGEIRYRLYSVPHLMPTQQRGRGHSESLRVVGCARAVC